MRIRSGYLSTKVILQKPVISQNESGQPVNTWVDVAVVWANLTDISGREFIASAALQTTVQTKIMIRYRTDVVPVMRIVHQTNIYPIEAILQQGRTSLLLMCSRRMG